jgi:hypothetical protein
LKSSQPLTTKTINYSTTLTQDLLQRPLSKNFNKPKVRKKNQNEKGQKVTQKQCAGRSCYWGRGGGAGSGQVKYVGVVEGFVF